MISKETAKSILLKEAADPCIKKVVEVARKNNSNESQHWVRVKPGFDINTMIAAGYLQKSCLEGPLVKPTMKCIALVKEMDTGDEF